MAELHPDVLKDMSKTFVELLYATTLQAALKRERNKSGRSVKRTPTSFLEALRKEVRSDWAIHPTSAAERAIASLAVDACTREVSAERVGSVLRTLRIRPFPEPYASSVVRKFDDLGREFRDRQVGLLPHPYVAVTTLTDERRRGRLDYRLAAAVATGVRQDGRREILGVTDFGPDEDELATELLLRLLSRGVWGTRLVLGPNLPRFRKTLQDKLADAAWQLSPAELLRDVAASVPRANREDAARVIEAIYDQPDRAGAEEQLAKAVQHLREFPRAAAALKAAREDLLAFTEFPRAHWAHIWANVPFDGDAAGHATHLARDRPGLFLVAEPPAFVAPAAPPQMPRDEPLPAPARSLQFALPGRARAITAAGAGAPAPVSPWEARVKNVSASLVVVAAVVCVAATLPGAWVMVGAIAIGVAFCAVTGVNRQHILTVLLAITVGATAIDYLAWRSVVANWSGWVIAAPLLAAEMFGALHTLGLQYTVFPATRQPPKRSRKAAKKPVFVLIPTVNEGRAVLSPTVKAAVEARRRFLEAFPDGAVTIAICNDGRVAGVKNWRDAEKLARELGVRCITRTVSGGHKAGNLEHARHELNATGESLIAIFDADQIARPEFLVKTVPLFADSEVGWVQTGQYYRNLHEPVARWANDQQALFYQVLCPGKEIHNAAFICGTNVVIRAAALDQIGGLPQDSVTEDFAASIKLHPNWRSIYLSEVLAEGLGPMDLPAYLKQQRRWAIGTISVLRTNWRDILLPRRNGLRVEQRIQYALACTHYLCGVRDLIYILAPIAFLVTGIPAVRMASLSLFLWHFLPYWAASQAAFWYAGRRFTGIRGVIIGFSSFPALLQALMTVITGRRTGFMVTSKQRRSGRSWNHLALYVAAIVLCADAVAIAMFNRELRHESVAISVLWVIYDIVLLGATLWLGIIDLRVRSGARSRAHPLLIPRLEDALRRQLDAGLISWRDNPGAATATALAACTVLLSFTGLATPRPEVLAVSRSAGQPPLLGLTLSYQDRQLIANSMSQELCLPFAIVGRTQNISDSLDVSWADRLAANGERPWITLQLANFNADGSVPLDASLPAIKNGIHDPDIQRWAKEIHDYGKPVYLTILLHVDRNWAVTSAVVNGGIPQDVPGAWEHVQSLFKAAGDTNVAWIWAPAEPAQDSPYAPPESTIDAVLQSMIRYPGTTWPDPRTVLNAVSARHPGKPLLIEVSAAGPAQEKAAWLRRVAGVVASDPLVYGLLYHDGSPDLHATPADNVQWSIQSDPQSLQAIRSWQALVPTTALPCAAGAHGGST